MITNLQHLQMLISPARSVVGRVELFEGSTLSKTFSPTDALSSFTVSRTGDKKFFGFGIAQELKLKLIDRERAINVAEGNILKILFEADGAEAVYPAPPFYVSSDIKRDENTNELTIKAYDAIYKAKAHTMAELVLTLPYTIQDVAMLIATALGLSGVRKVGVTDTSFSTSYQVAANFDGAETFRETLDAIAGATQTIYYIDKDNYLVFKRLDKNGIAALTINKANYFTLNSKNNRILAEVCSATELGNNIVVSAPGVSGEIQYVRDNPFWKLRDDITTLLEAAITAVGGLSINEFSCKWRGNYLLEPGDKIKLITKDDGAITSYLLDEQYTYDGGLVAETKWEYADNEEEGANNPITLGEQLHKTFSKVDKALGQIDLVAKKNDELTSQVASIQINTDSVSSSVQQIEKVVDNSFGEINENLAILTEKVESSITSDELKIEVQKALVEGANSVTTSTGFAFNEDGLFITKSDSEMETQITEDGMKVFKNDSEVLTADNEGVKAINLHAATYLIVGNSSRFEDYDNNGTRTGCFWLGQ